MALSWRIMPAAWKDEPTLETARPAMKILEEEAKVQIVEPVQKTMMDRMKRTFVSLRSQLG